MTKESATTSPALTEDNGTLATSAKPSTGFTVSLPCLFPACLAATLQIVRGATIRESQKWRGVRQSLPTSLKFFIGSSSSGLTRLCGPGSPVTPSASPDKALIGDQNSIGSSATKANPAARMDQSPISNPSSRPLPDISLSRPLAICLVD